MSSSCSVKTYLRSSVAKVDSGSGTATVAEDAEAAAVLTVKMSSETADATGAMVLNGAKGAIDFSGSGA